MDKKLFEELADLRIKEKEITTRIKEILPVIYAEVDGLEGGTPIDLKSGKGTFTVAYGITWKFSDEIEAIGERYEAEKDKAKQLGTAEKIEKVQLKFKSNKDENN